MLKTQHFHTYYINGEKKHSTVRIPILANRFWSVFSFTVIFQHSNSGSSFDKDVLSCTKYKY
uniref:Uncharacterized protein n=1 Tax=Rhinolophus ferrumequinum TaxID=59479 RepID=A0A671FYD4_RHIFE